LQLDISKVTSAARDLIAMRNQTSYWYVVPIF